MFILGPGIRYREGLLLRPVIGIPREIMASRKINISAQFLVVIISNLFLFLIVRGSQLSKKVIKMNSESFP